MIASQNTESESISRKKAFPSRKFLLVGLTWMMLLVPVLRANASLWSLFSKSLSGSSAYASDNTINENTNTQNMPILKHEESIMATRDVPHYNSDGTTLLPDISILKTLDGDEEKLYLEASDEISVYIVKKGDTLSEIADMYEVSVNTVAWANNINRSKALVEGQELVILPVSGVYHTIKKGESLKSIASKYGADMQEIVAFNDIDTSTALVLGKVIIVPDGEIAVPKIATSGVASSSGKNNSTKTYFIRPVRGIKSQGLHGHNGIDFAGKIGDVVLAGAEGTVLIAREGWNGGYGTYVVIKHPNGMQTLYGHLSKISVSAGQKVSQGQMVGQLGNTGKSTGPHLHFEVRGGSNPF